MGFSKRSAFFPFCFLKDRSTLRVKLITCKKTACEFRKGRISSISRISVGWLRDIFMLEGVSKIQRYSKMSSLTMLSWFQHSLCLHFASASYYNIEHCWLLFAPFWHCLVPLDHGLWLEALSTSLLSFTKHETRQCWLLGGSCDRHWVCSRNIEGV